MVLYQLHDEPRMADICAGLERAGGEATTMGPQLLAARRALDACTARVMLETMKAPLAASASASVHQLFYHRLADGPGGFPGGRYLRYYLSDPTFVALAEKRWRVNGVEYRSSLSDLAGQAARLLAPASLSALPVVTAHGDDHHGNIWALCACSTPPLPVLISRLCWPPSRQPSITPWLTRSGSTTRARPRRASASRPQPTAMS